MKANHIAFGIDNHRYKAVLTNRHLAFEYFSSMRCCSFSLN